MIGVSRFVAPVLGACLFTAPALAQDRAVFVHPTTSFPSPNRDLSPPETVWHLRSALNVAALACRGPDGDEMVLLYNAMLNSEKRPLADAATGTEAAYKARYAARWQDAEDTSMTRVYNFYASQPGHDAFCATAHDLLREVVTVEPSSFADFAAAALPRLEAPIAPAYAPSDPRSSERPPIIAETETASAPVALASLTGPEAQGGVPSVVTIAYNGPRR